MGGLLKFFFKRYFELGGGRYVNKEKHDEVVAKINKESKKKGFGGPYMFTLDPAKDGDPFLEKVPKTPQVPDRLQLIRERAKVNGIKK